MNPLSKRTPGRPKATENEASASIKETILRTASQLFMEFGYEQISLIQIAEASGVTKATVYYYYSNKAHLFTSAIVQIMHNIRRYTSQIMQQEASLRQRLQNVAEAHLRKAHVDFESLMKEVSSALTAQQLAEMRAAELAIHQELAKEFQKSIDVGEINRGHTLLMSYAFSAIMMLGNRQPTSQLFTSPQAAAKEIVDLFWHGIQNGQDQ